MTSPKQELRRLIQKRIQSIIECYPMDAGHGHTEPPSRHAPANAEAARKALDAYIDSVDIFARRDPQFGG